LLACRRAFWARLRSASKNWPRRCACRLRWWNARPARGASRIFPQAWLQRARSIDWRRGATLRRSLARALPANLAQTQGARGWQIKGVQKALFSLFSPLRDSPRPRGLVAETKKEAILFLLRR